MAPELGAGTRGARADDSSPTLDPRVTCDSGETNPDTRAETARRPVWSEADDVPPGLESKASRARARRQWRVAADAFRQWRRRGRVAAGARRALATVGKHRAFARTTVVAAIASWRCLTIRERRAANEADAARVAARADAVSLREREVSSTVEELVAGELRDAARAVEAARISEEEAKRRAARKVRAAELERDAHCEDAERERARAAAAEAEGVAAARRAAESLAEEARRAACVAAADAAAEREWLRVALEKAWAEVLARRRSAGAKNADASLHEHLASVAGEAWADELAKALVPPAGGAAATPMLAPAPAPVSAGAAAIKNTRESPEKKSAEKKPKSAKARGSAPARSPHWAARGANPPNAVGRVVGVARRDFVVRASSQTRKETESEFSPETRDKSAARLTPAWRAPSAADPSPLAAKERGVDREAARERARARREGRFGDRGSPSTRAKSSPWTPRSLNVSSRAASLLGLAEAPRDPLGASRASVPGGAEPLARRPPPTRRLAEKARLADEAWETSRARFALSREAFRAAVERRLAGAPGNAEAEGLGEGEPGVGASPFESFVGGDARASAPYSVQTPGGTWTGKTESADGFRKTESRLGVASAGDGALALAAAAARRFALPGDTDTDESDGGSSESDEHEWLFREEKSSAASS